MKTISKLQTVRPDLINVLASALLILHRRLFASRDEAQKLLDVIQGTKLKNALDQYPQLKHTKPLPNGSQYTLYLPPGIALKEFIGRKPYFETFLAGDVAIYPPNNNHLILQVHHANFPEKIPFDFHPPKDMLAPLPLGLSMDGTPLYTDLSELPHLLIGGLPGYGKTSLLRTLAVALKLSGVEVVAVDRKRLDFPPLKQWLNVAETEEEAFALIQTLLNENDRRQTLLAAAGVTKIQDYPHPLPYIVAIIDEAAAIETKQTCEGIDSLARLARATGISLLLATQKPSARLWDGTFSNTRDMMAGRISFFVADYMSSQMILGKGNTSACRLPMIKGRAVTVLGEREYTVQTMFLDDKEAKSLLSDLDKPPYFPTIAPAELKKKKVGRPKKKKEE